MFNFTSAIQCKFSNADLDFGFELELIKYCDHVGGWGEGRGMRRWLLLYALSPPEVL